MNNIEKNSPTSIPEQKFERTDSKSEPVQMTQKEVEIMAAGGEEAQRLAEKLSSGSANFGFTKTSPVDVSAAEMESLQKEGVTPPRIRERIEQSANEPDTTDVKTKKTLPAQVPSSK